MLDPVRKIVVDQEQCNGCGKCVASCPGEVYELRDGKAVAGNPESCHCCRTCEDICDRNACHIIDEA